MKKFALTGYPLGHSMSPFIHNKLFQCTQTEAEYGLFEVSPEKFEKNWSSLKKLNGFNVTIPHKLTVVSYLDSMDEKAALFGAVNTVHVTDNGIKGYNTDCCGFTRSAKAAGIALSGDVLVCGAGGVSRMFAFECAAAGAQVTIAARDIKKAAGLKQEIREKLKTEVKTLPLDQINEGYDLIINGTPVGMYPNIDACPVTADTIRRSKAVFDAIYNPLQTKLIAWAKADGLTCVNGLPMLVWQAAAAQEIWNTVKFSEREIQTVIELTEKEIQKI